MYIAFITDASSRMVVGWQASRSLRSELAFDALEMAVHNRRRAGAGLSQLPHHSDRGVPTPAAHESLYETRGDSVVAFTLLFGTCLNGHRCYWFRWLASTKVMGGSSGAWRSERPRHRPRVSRFRRLIERSRPAKYATGVLFRCLSPSGV